MPALGQETDFYGSQLLIDKLPTTITAATITAATPTPAAPADAVPAAQQQHGGGGGGTRLDSRSRPRPNRHCPNRRAYARRLGARRTAAAESRWRTYFTRRFSADSLPRFGTISNVTLAPSGRPSRPAFSTAEIWTKTSLPPPSGAMKP